MIPRLSAAGLLCLLATGPALACSPTAREVDALFLQDGLAPNARAEAATLYAHALRRCAEGKPEQAGAIFAAAREILTRSLAESAESLPKGRQAEGTVTGPPP